MENACNIVKFDSDNLIYNRFDLIYPDNVEEFVYEYDEELYSVFSHYDGKKATVNTWGKKLPQAVFSNLIRDIFSKHPEIRYLEIRCAGNNYDGLLIEENDIRINLPETSEELLLRLRGKHRTTIKRMKTLVEEKIGKMRFFCYHSDIPDEIVKKFFCWKEKIQGINYHMQPDEYLKKYYVTDAILLKAEETSIAVLFFCQVKKTVYFENFSYNPEMKKFSPGYIIYEMFLEELIRRKCLIVYLGGGDYLYKRRFGAEEETVYSGRIYRKEVIENINHYFKDNGLENIAIYGLGREGTLFWNMRSLFCIKIKYGIDREKKRMGDLSIHAPTDEMESVDAVIITLKYYSEEVKQFLDSKFKKVFYWTDIVNKAIGFD